jgi:hypothetical protein
MQTVGMQHAVTIRKYENISASSAHARISSSGNASMILADELNWKVEFRPTNRVWNWLATSVVDNQHLKAWSIFLVQQTPQTGFQRLPIIEDADNNTENRPAARREEQHFRQARIAPRL